MKCMASLLTLDSKGLLLACAMGLLILFFGGQYGILLLADILAFLILSYIVTNLGKVRKNGIGMYERARGWKNVLSNGLFPVFIAFLYFINAKFAFVPGNLLLLAYIASVAAVTADKFSSEIGVLDGKPRMLLTMKTVAAGTSGGVTVIGLLASLLGAVLVSTSVVFIHGSLSTLIIVAFSGFFGGIVDSVLGYFEEQGIGNKYTSNFACSVAGALVCALLVYLL